MYLAQLTDVDELDRFVWQVEQPDRVQYVGSATTQTLCRHTASDMQVFEQGRKRSGLFDHGEVF